MLLILSGLCAQTDYVLVKPKVVARGYNSPLNDVQIVCYNKFFNEEVLTNSFLEEHNLNNKQLYKRQMIVEIFMGKRTDGIDSIVLVAIKEYKGKVEIEYNLLNLGNDESKAHPFLIVQIPKSRKDIFFIENGKARQTREEMYIKRGVP